MPDVSAGPQCHEMHLERVYEYFLINVALIIKRSQKSNNQTSSLHFAIVVDRQARLDTRIQGPVSQQSLMPKGSASYLSQLRFLVCA